MKRLRAILAVSACLSALVGCTGEPPEAARGRDVVRPALGLAVDVPDGWTWSDVAGDVVLEIVRRPADEAGATEGGPRPKRLRPVVHVVVVDREGVTLDGWADQAVADSKELQVDLEVSGRTPARLADGREALALRLRSERALEPLVQQLLLTVTETRAYAVVATAPESDAKAAEPAFKECFDSFVVW
jgi:hypothetical protein